MALNERGLYPTRSGCRHLAPLPLTLLLFGLFKTPADLLRIWIARSSRHFKQLENYSPEKYAPPIPRSNYGQVVLLTECLERVDVVRSCCRGLTSFFCIFVLQHCTSSFFGIFGIFALQRCFLLLRSIVFI